MLVSSVVILFIVFVCLVGWLVGCLLFLFFFCMGFFCFLFVVVFLVCLFVCLFACLLCVYLFICLVTPLRPLGLKDSNFQGLILYRNLVKISLFGNSNSRLDLEFDGRYPGIFINKVW